MATLSIRPRRTKKNPYPLSMGPLARWQKDPTHIALRADGSVVRRVGSGTWTVITLSRQGTPLGKKGLTVDEVHELLAAAGYRRNGIDRSELDRLPY
jgi:hypothetical protein